MSRGKMKIERLCRVMHMLFNHRLKITSILLEVWRNRVVGCKTMMYIDFYEVLLIHARGRPNQSVDIGDAWRRVAYFKEAQKSTYSSSLPKLTAGEFLLDDAVGRCPAACLSAASAASIHSE